MSPFIGYFERSSSSSIHFSRHKLLPNYNVKRVLLVPFHHTPYGDCTVIALFFWYLITWVFLNVSQLRGSEASRIQSSPALRECHGNRCQSMSLKTVVLWLSIDHRLTNINRYQLSNWNQLLLIDWLIGFPIIDSYRLYTLDDTHQAYFHLHLRGHDQLRLLGGYKLQTTSRYYGQSWQL